MDIYLPVDAEILLRIGDVTRGGITPLAIIRQKKDSAQPTDS